MSREHVKFDDFRQAGKCAESLASFQDGDIKDSFLMLSCMGFYSSSLKTALVSREKIRDVLGEEFSNKQDYSFDSFFDKCHLVNDLLEIKGLFL